MNPCSTALEVRTLTIISLTQIYKNNLIPLIAKKFKTKVLLVFVQDIE